MAKTGIIVQPTAPRPQTVDLAARMAEYLGCPVSPEDVTVLAALLAEGIPVGTAPGQVQSVYGVNPSGKPEPAATPKLCGCAPNMLCDFCMPKDYPEP